MKIFLVLCSFFFNNFHVPQHWHFPPGNHSISFSTNMPKLIIQVALKFSTKQRKFCNASRGKKKKGEKVREGEGGREDKRLLLSDAYETSPKTAEGGDQSAFLLDRGEGSDPLTHP